MWDTQGNAWQYIMTGDTSSMVWGQLVLGPMPGNVSSYVKVGGFKYDFPWGKEGQPAFYVWNPEDARAIINERLSGGVIANRGPLQGGPNHIIICGEVLNGQNWNCLNEDNISVLPRPVQCGLTGLKDVDFGTAAASSSLPPVALKATLSCSSAANVTVTIRGTDGKDTLTLGTDATVRMDLGHQGNGKSLVRQADADQQDLDIIFELTNSGLALGEKSGVAIVELIVM